MLWSKSCFELVRSSFVGISHFLSLHSKQIFAYSSSVCEYLNWREYGKDKKSSFLPYMNAIIVIRFSVRNFQNEIPPNLRENTWFSSLCIHVAILLYWMNFLHYIYPQSYLRRFPCYIQFTFTIYLTHCFQFKKECLYYHIYYL